MRYLSVILLLAGITFQAFSLDAKAMSKDKMMDEQEEYDEGNHLTVDQLIKEEHGFDKELEEWEVKVVPENPKSPDEHDADVMHVMHELPPEDEANAGVGGYIFDTDGERNPNQRCFIRNQGTDKTKMPDNIENSVVDAQEQLNQDGTNRAQWAKCLPPPMYTLLSIASFAEGDIYNGRYEKRMRNATDFYATLKWLHNEACSHIRLRLVHPVMQKKIRDEVNFRDGVGTGVKIRDEVMKIIDIIVKQHRSRDANLNPKNAKVFELLKKSIPPMQQALRVAEHADVTTLESGFGRRRNDCKPNVNEMLNSVKSQIMEFDIGKLEGFLDERPGPLDDYLTGNAARGLGDPSIGSDSIPDALKNYGRCGQPLFDYSGYTLWTLSLSLDKKGDITMLSRDGWVAAEEIRKKAQTHPLVRLLPPDAYEIETKTTTYQDDLFSQGNLACGNRADGLWTLVSYDRNSNTNQVTATQEEGYFCVWMLNDLIHLPEGQRAGFSNTEFIAESPEEMARVMNGNADGYKKYFPGPGEKYKYYHCHYAPTNSGAARVHSFQHQAERHYPGGIRQYCNCDWRRMAMLVSRCDCTLDAKANGGCRRVEMEMLNEHTQIDIWRKDGKKDQPSRVVMVHGDLAEGRIKSYTYNNNRRRRNPDNVNEYQEDTGRVRPTTDGNGGNNVVCSVDENGNPANAATRTFTRGNSYQGLAKIDKKKRTFFADLNKNGIVDYPECATTKCSKKGREFPISDIYSPSTVASPAGGSNREFERKEDNDEVACNALDMKKDCKPADAGWREGAALIHYLAKFCDTEASLYRVPIVMAEHKKGNWVVPEDFGAATFPVPFCVPGKCTNFRSVSRADFGALGKGSWLQCQTKNCHEGQKPTAVQGTFNTDVDKYVYSKSPSDAYTRPWYPTIGGSKEGAKPSGVPTKWTMKGSLASGIFNQDILKNHWMSTNPGAKFAKSIVESEGKRDDGVTCLNGKYVYARKMLDGSRPVVSTVREALNRNGPVAKNGQWSCRYLGVHCNANNCNNNGNGEVAGPFVPPKVTDKKTNDPYTMISTGAAGPSEKWSVNLKGMGVEECYKAVLQDSDCAKDYFSYAQRGDENCGCKKSYGALSVRDDSRTDYYRIHKK